MANDKKTTKQLIMYKGLNGFWDVFKTVVVAVGGYFGGPFGAYVTSIAFEGISSWVSGNEFDTGVFDPFSKSNQSQAELMNWHDVIFAPWIKIEAQKMKTVGININTANYRQKINTLLLKLEALRLYYKSKEVSGKSFGVSEEQLNAAKSKAEIIDIYIKAISQAYRKTLSDNNVIASRTKITFKAHQAQFNAPETLNWNALTATTESYIFTEKNQQAIPSIDYNGLIVGASSSSSNPSFTNIDQRLPDSTNQDSSEQVVSQANLSKWFAGIIVAIGIGSYYTRKSKTKK